MFLFCLSGGEMPPYKLPFSDELCQHPTFEDMQVHVSRGRKRPAFPDAWKENNQVKRTKSLEMLVLIRDCVKPGSYSLRMLYVTRLFLQQKPTNVSYSLPFCITFTFAASMIQALLRIFLGWDICRPRIHPRYPQQWTDPAYQSNCARSPI